jgi:hypothetical protein
MKTDDRALFWDTEPLLTWSGFMSLMSVVVERDDGALVGWPIMLYVPPDPFVEYLQGSTGLSFFPVELEEDDE